MKENKTLIVAIATVAILVVVFTGGTYAFFTANNNNNLSTSTVAVTGGAMKITYSDGTNDLGGKLSSTNFQPSDDILVDKTFTLVGKNTATADGGLEMEYYIGIEYSSTFTEGELHWYLKRTTTNDNITSEIIGDVTSIPGHSEYTRYNHGTFSPSCRYVKLVTGVFKPIPEEQTITFNLKLQFPDIGVEQDENKGATFTGKILVNEEVKLTAAEYLISIASTEKGQTYLRYDETADNNLRYYGGSATDENAVPNYISFNNELWRIIGVFDTYDVETKNTKKALKIVRSNALGTESTKENINSSEYTGYSWDVAHSSISSKGINEWSQADLMIELNGDYLNPSLENNIYWYAGNYQKPSAVFDSSSAISYEFQNYIMNARWNLGGYTANTSVSAADMYKYERGKWFIKMRVME